MQQQSDTPSAQFDLAVIGSGPGGYEASLHAARHGLKVCLVEKAALGGVCVNWGCIPTKALLRSAEVYDLAQNPANFGVNVGEVSFDLAQAVKRSRNVALKSSKGVEFMLKKAKVEVWAGEAVLTGGAGVTVTAQDGSARLLEARNIIVATGSKQRVIPGLEPDGKKIITSREALILKEVPASMIVVGGGAIGVEMAWFYAKAGAQVTIVELMPRILPAEEAEVSEALKRSFEKAGIAVHCGAKLDRVAVSESGVSAELIVEGAEPQKLEATLLLVAVGVSGAIDELGLEAAGVETERGFIRTDELCHTSAPGIYAIGDVRGGMLLAHKASAEAAIAVEAIVGKSPEPLSEPLIPRCVYAQPSVASVGLTEEAAIKAGYQVLVGRSQFAASGKANAFGQLEGFVKLVFDATNGKMLGGHLIGHDAVELIGELGLACRLGVTAEGLASTIHAHPTLSETVKEAAFAALQSMG
ncbi:dihydrolipoyl dehydrogenase [Chlorobaculum thiosulfatiphilum]|uniref:Dihydrolipoyl dehydrogenase n=1 Tax=Chlorobaculum thiosulfatiphilum TaxID=115852 RepID=A0A5C4SAV3_CHLTI|nr:dihydrolipoyl dehydrogenase [Chlorobaculum thiosulfatiphilum]TNJ40402.1 dihydrolipoyl dehydrogenase [Chlorobaculum thiosulfatiphilum]